MKDISAMPRYLSGKLPAEGAPTVEAKRDRQELAEILAHEFSNLLTPIMGYAEMAADALMPESSPGVYVERIRRAGDRARQAIEQLLASDRSDAEQDCFFDAAYATKEILSDVRMYIPPSSQLLINIPDRPVWLRGSAINLQQVIINLCKNAAEAMHTNGSVTVGIGNFAQKSPRTVSHGRLESGKYVLLTVSDTGPGIPEELMDHIFDPFFTTKSHAGGTGLGLAMVFRVVSAWNGAINITSAPGRGTTLEIFIPCADPAAKTNNLSATVAVSYGPGRQERRRRTFRSHTCRRGHARRKARSGQ